MSNSGKKIDTVYIVVCAALCIFFCSGCARSSVYILSGTLQWENGSYDDAVYSFLSAVSAAQSEGNAEREQYGTCGLAACYYARNEIAAAEKLISSLEQSGSQDVASFAWYTAGLIAYRNQHYEQAANNFKESLRCNNAFTDARINLELCARAAEQSAAAQKSAIGAGEENGVSAPDDPLSQMIHRKEVDQWKSAVHPEPPQPSDY